MKRLKSMNSSQIIDYQNNIKSFIKSRKFDQFELKHSTTKIIQTILFDKI